MLKQLLLLQRGYVCILVSGGSGERFFNVCAARNILFWNLQKVSNGYRAFMYASDVLLLPEPARKCHTKIKICEKHGIPFWMKRNRMRVTLVSGFFICLCLIWILSCFIWKISIEGNQSISRRTLLTYLEESGTSYGTFKRKIDLSALVLALREEFSEFTWASAEIKGTELILRVQEDTNKTESLTECSKTEDLISDTDGKIVHMITRSGTPKCHVGDFVGKGDVLVEGNVEITDDSDQVISIRPCQADADIYVETEKKYQDQLSCFYTEEAYTGKKKSGWYIRIGTRYYEKMPNTISFASSEIIRKEYQCRLMPDFYLPIIFGRITLRECYPVKKSYTKQEAAAVLKKRLHEFILKQEEDGTIVLEHHISIKTKGSSVRAEGTVLLIKKVGGTD